MKSKYRAINGKLGRSHVIGCHARCFCGLDDSGCNNWKVLLRVWRCRSDVLKFGNMQYNQKDQIIHICSQALTAISERVS